MRKNLFCLFCFTAFFCTAASAQKALPFINIKNFDGKIIISWLNKYQRIPKALYIQRSSDSLKNYYTIASMLNPENIENGYADNKPPKPSMYYRVFVAFAGGSYVFSEVRRAGKTEPGTNLNSSDSIALAVLPPVINPHNNSVYVGKENNVIIELADAADKKYRIRFFNESGKPVFELTKIQEAYLILEKVNFTRAGWYNYEIYEKDKSVEKSKFYIPKDLNMQSPQIIEKGKKNR
jgi:hypothetical protein